MMHDLVGLSDVRPAAALRKSPIPRFTIEKYIAEMSSNLPYKQVKNVERRTWNKQEYLDRAEARSKANSDEDALARKSAKRPLSAVAAALTDDYEKEEFIPAEAGAAGPLNSQRSFLKARKDRVDLDSKLGSVEIINPEAVGPSSVSHKDGVTASANGIGWHCAVCDCWLRDSITYVDHINGKKHQKYLGFSMRTGKSSNEQVKNKLAELAKQKKQSQGDDFFNSKKPIPEGRSKNLFDEAKAKERTSIEEDSLSRTVEKDNGNSSKEDVDESDESCYEEESGNQNMAAIMGFSGFT